MDEFEEILIDLIDEEEEEIEGEDDVKLAEIFRLANRLIRLLEDIKSHELRESASLMLIKEIVGEDKLLLGLASKMLQDITFNHSDDEKYVS
ncbi:hypothetical protein DRP05_01660 [Archaeoglobales archaeon]|nr:MAG: hypothetical protein DRP05_01660 [Archaeoglobales archaeon]